MKTESKCVDRLAELAAKLQEIGESLTNEGERENLSTEQITQLCFLLGSLEHFVGNISSGVAMNNPPLLQHPIIGGYIQSGKLPHEIRQVQGGLQMVYSGQLSTLEF